ncbi:unnamed protein product [Chondrus crispus]|uniref:Uncharacterized protein n=1 Tax=Chondrus crispus TaxID=2769 RepID=S0F380_CHOCR|nr:unnamed protein product [Chondrus crispus]CDF77512.1 unnamed protein product [Chondrus crispus]|eukprot:XP_005712551.1 unnamed protein product [Chondrus crispus]
MSISNSSTARTALRSIPCPPSLNVIAKYQVALPEFPFAIARPYNATARTASRSTPSAPFSSKTPRFTITLTSSPFSIARSNSSIDRVLPGG